MKVATAAQMRRIDEAAQADYNLAGDDLMERAGITIARRAMEHFTPTRVCVVCGKGNNGGDGFVAARELHVRGVAVDVVALTGPEHLRGSAARAYMRLAPHVNIAGPEALAAALRSCDLVVDAILGIGIQGGAKIPAAHAIRAINESRRPVLAVDVPSGLWESPDPALLENSPIVKAAMTVTLGLPKLALLTMPGAELAGRVIVEAIQFPSELLEDADLSHNWICPTELAQWLPPRPADSNKGDFGRVGIVAGSASFAGAAILVARAALRSGCGLVFIFTTRQLNPLFKIALPEAVTVIVDSHDPDWLDESSADAILEKASSLDVMAIGPGLGTGPPRRNLVRRLVSECRSLPLVLDADALTDIAAASDDGGASMGDLLAGRDDCLLTPHPGEMARLVGNGASAGDVQKDRMALARTFASRYGTNLLLKGASSLLARPDGQVFITPGATSALAKGGTGDVLTGLTASLMAQGLPAWKAGVAGAALHLEAGRRCGRRLGNHGVLASEVADELALAMRDREL